MTCATLNGAFSFFRRLIRKISNEHKKKHEKSGATGLRSRWRCEKCAKSRVSRFRSKVPSAHGARDIFCKIFGAAPVGWPGGRGQTTQRLTETRTMHGASSFFFTWSPGQEARPFMRPRSGQMCPASDHASVGPPRRALTKV